jgi:hypothetical protein
MFPYAHGCQRVQERKDLLKGDYRDKHWWVAKDSHGSEHTALLTAACRRPSDALSLARQVIFSTRSHVQVVGLPAAGFRHRHCDRGLREHVSVLP